MSGKMALNDINCKNSGLPFGECHCPECEEDFKLREQMKANGYQLDRSDNEEKL
jgi:hypothetical protein